MHKIFIYLFNLSLCLAELCRIAGNKSIELNGTILNTEHVNTEPFEIRYLSNMEPFEIWNLSNMEPS